MRNHLMRIRLFLLIVWRPANGDEGDSWLRAWLKYRLDVGTAWEVAGIVWLDGH